MDEQKQQPQKTERASSQGPLARLGLALASVFFWLWLVSTGLTAFFTLVIPFWLIGLVADRNRKLLHWWCCCWGWAVVLPSRLLGLWSLKVTGKQHWPRAKSAVYVANHLSQLDILAMFTTFRHFKWVSKASIFPMPIFGWAMWMAGYIPLKRGDTASVRAMLDDCEKALKRGDSVMVFPEGTRSRDGRLQSFKAGAFSLAKSANKPIVPIVIKGTRDALPKHGWRLPGRARMSIEFLEPISAERVATSEPRVLMQELRQLYLAKLGQSETEAPESEDR